MLPNIISLLPVKESAMFLNTFIPRTTFIFRKGHQKLQYILLKFGTQKKKIVG